MIKIIRCPSCGEEIVLKDLYEGMEITCSLCGYTIVYQNGKLHIMETNEEFELEELASSNKDETEKELEEEELEGDYEDYYDY